MHYHSNRDTWLDQSSMKLVHFHAYIITSNFNPLVELPASLQPASWRERHCAGHSEGPYPHSQGRDLGPWRPLEPPPVYHRSSQT